MARLGSISRAAEALFITQPALTARIQALERALGAQLLHRGRIGSRLTEAGRAFLPHAGRSLAALERGRMAVADVASGSGGRLTIGAAPAVSTYVLPAMLHRFRETHPAVQLSVRSGHSEEVLGMVLREEVEIGLMRPIQHAEITASLLLRMSSCWWCTAATHSPPAARSGWPRWRPSTSSCSTAPARTTS